MPLYTLRVYTAASELFTEIPLRASTSLEARQEALKWRCVPEPVGKLEVLSPSARPVGCWVLSDGAWGWVGAVDAESLEAAVTKLQAENAKLHAERTDWDSVLGAIKERLLDAFPEAEVPAIGERFRGKSIGWSPDSVRALAVYVAALARKVPTEPLACTEVDVQFWERMIKDSWKGREGEGAPGSLASLVAVALEGAKVPGLVADNAALLEDFQAWVKRTSHHDRVTFVKEAVRRNPRGTALLAEHAREVSTLQARVAELERERDERAGQHERQMDGARQAVDAVRKFQARAESERDALRAQVAPMREALEWIERETHPEDGLTFERIHAKAAAALSATPAETKKVPISDAAWCAKAAAREEDSEVSVGPPAETKTCACATPEFGQFLVCRRCGGGPRVTPAETTPAPERAEG